MLLKTRALILRNVKYGETSLIVDAYTLEKGRQSFVVNGVRSPKAKIKQSTLGVTSLLDIVMYFREDKDVQRLKEAKPSFVYTGIPFDVFKGTVGLFMAELVSKTVKESEQNEELFLFLEDAFQSLDRADKIGLFPLVFTVQLMPFLGFSPGNSYSKENSFFDMREGLFVSREPHTLYMPPACAAAFDAVRQSGEPHSLEIPKKIRKRTLDFLLEYYRYHVEGFKEMNSHVIMGAVLG